MSPAGGSAAMPTRVVSSTPLGLDENDLVRCVACGLCLPHCPTYRVTGLEIASPRGRIAAMRAVESGEAPLDAVFEEAILACVQCRGCEAACPSSVPYGRLVGGARTALAAQGPIGAVSLWRRFGEWLAFCVVLPRHGLVTAVSWVLWVVQRLHLVPRRFGLPRLSARSMRRGLDAPRGPSISAGGARRALRSHRRNPGRRDVDTEPDAWLFTGCVMDAWSRDVHRSALRVMRAAGATVRLPGRGGDCCGALHLHAGREREAHTLALGVIASMPGNAKIVVDSAGCGAAMQEYGNLLDTPDAHAFAARVQGFSTWLAERGVPPLRSTGQTVVVQDACHLRHVQRAHTAVRTVLAGACDLRETADDGLCCGAGGAYSLARPELSRSIRERKVAAIEEACAGLDPATVTVVSANPGCIYHLGAAGLTVRHPAEVLAEALAPEALGDD